MPAKGEDKRFLQAAVRRNKILDRLAAAGATLTSVTPYELQKIAKHEADEEQEQMSYEARRVRDAKDKAPRAGKVKRSKFASLVDQFNKDPVFAARQAENGFTRHDVLRAEVIAKGFLGMLAGPLQR